MSEHLPVVLSPFFNVDDDNLLKPKGELSKVIPFVEARHGWLRKVLPHGWKIEEVGGRSVDVLVRIVSMFVINKSRSNHIPCRLGS